MNKVGKILIVVILIAAVAAVIALKGNKPSKEVGRNAASISTEDTAKLQPDIQKEKSQDNRQPATASPPRLLDLGATKCIPCKMMAPILEELKREHEGRLKVEFIDVWEKPDEAKKYDIRLIPTQIFFDASGREKFRHEGFFSKEDILRKWKELGVNLEKGANNETN